MATTTPNRALPVVELTEAANARTLNNNLALPLDNVASIYSGSLASRGAASSTPGTAKGCPGTLYVATDTGQLFVSLAGAWVDLTGAQVPVGGSVEYVGNGDPSDVRWLLEDGRALARSGQYAPLFVVCGTAYGAGDGSTTFNIPDSRGRVTVGPDNMGTAAGAAGRLAALAGRGNVGGEEKHLLTGAESGTPVHTHGNTFAVANNNIGQPSGWNMPIGDSAFDSLGLLFGTGGFAGNFARNLGNNGSYTSGVHSHSLTGGVSNSAAVNASQSHNTMQPYVVKNKIIRVL